MMALTRMSGPSRREALLGAAAVSAVRAVAATDALPTVKLGPHTVSRLIVGGNPVSGNSHTSDGLGREMRDYFTAENVKKMLRNCEQAGINTWQSRGDKHIQRLLTEYRGEGGRIQWIVQTASELANIPGHIRDLASMKPVGIYHHGSQTDKFWAAGKIEQAREMCKVMRDTGVQVGLGTHIPEVIDYVESKAWDVDFYMTCVYNLSRHQGRAGEAGGAQGRRPALLASGPREDARPGAPDHQTVPDLQSLRRQPQLRLTGDRCWTSLRLAAKYAKPKDAIVIGMFPKHSEQVNQNCRLVMQALGETATT